MQPVCTPQIAEMLADLHEGLVLPVMAGMMPLVERPRGTGRSSEVSLAKATNSPLKRFATLESGVKHHDMRQDPKIGP